MNVTRESAFSHIPSGISSGQQHIVGLKSDGTVISVDIPDGEIHVHGEIDPPSRRF